MNTKTKIWVKIPCDTQVKKELIERFDQTCVFGFEALLNRRSCRNFEDRPVSDEDINTIVECGLQAPSGTNRQDTKIIIVKDAETR